MLRATSSAPDRARVAEMRVELQDGASTTVHAVWHPRDATDVRVVALERPEPLAAWCRRSGVQDAIVGGFFTRPEGQPLGDLRVAGRALASVPFQAPWGRVRACVHTAGPAVTIAHRHRLGPRPRGDLLQAGPMLVDGGRVVNVARDREGFQAAAHQFDSDITAGRYPRAALALTAESVVAVVCDGRGPRDCGLGLQELAQLLVSWGVEQALNLDGGGSASLVSEGRLRNRPREAHGIDLLEGRPISTAIAFTPRG